MKMSTKVEIGFMIAWPDGRVSEIVSLEPAMCKYTHEEEPHPTWITKGMSLTDVNNTVKFTNVYSKKEYNVMKLLAKIR